MEYDKNLYSSLEAIKQKYDELSKKLEQSNLRNNKYQQNNKTYTTSLWKIFSF